jgi:selenide,water dikinase
MSSAPLESPASSVTVAQSAQQQVVLVGLGHTNVQVLLKWARMRPTQARLICVSDQLQASYSGMLPGVLAGQYAPAEMLIDLPALCRQADAELVIANWSGLDRERRELQFTDRAPIHYDLLSIGIGSRPSLAGVVVSPDAPLVSIKPMQSLVERLRAAATRSSGSEFSGSEFSVGASSVGESISSERDDRQRRDGRPATNLRVIVVGGGAGGFEVACTLPRFLERQGQQRPSLTLVTRSADILPTLARSTRQLARRHLQQQGVSVLTNHEVQQVQRDHLMVRVRPGAGQGDALKQPADLVLWLASAVGAPILSQLGLPTDAEGFLLVNRTLQSIADARIFAVGDAGTIACDRLPKAGVFAVRQGPILWENILRSLRGEPLLDYQPQRPFLQLLNLSDGRAIASYGRWSLSGRWAWRLKDAIDRRFMRTMRSDRSKSA